MTNSPYSCSFFWYNMFIMLFIHTSSLFSKEIAILEQLVDLMEAVNYVYKEL